MGLLADDTFPGFCQRWEGVPNLQGGENAYNLDLLGIFYRLKIVKTNLILLMEFSKEGLRNRGRECVEESWKYWEVGGGGGCTFG